MRFRPVIPLMFPCLLAPGPGLGADSVWLVGGGPDVFGTQVQIERNVLWALEALARLPGSRETRVYFTDGNDPAPDLTEWAPPEETPASLQPLARVFDSHWSNGESYRNHRIPGVAGPAEARFLREDLSRQWRALDPRATGWLIFNGHGSHGKGGNNRLVLWDGTFLSVRQLERLLDQAPRAARLRFLFTQCYAGGFAALAAPGTQRCGFLAEAADREAEGCSAAIDASGYQDYSTYFFAALIGRTREGAPLEARADRDGDGRVSPLEAHWYTLGHAFSSDIPRSTSEVLLEEWQPWYGPALSPWLGDGDPEYGALARILTRQAGIDPGEDPELQIVHRLAELQEARTRLEQVQGRHQQESVPLREGLEREVLRRWPRANAAHTAHFQRFLEEDRIEAQSFILAHPDYGPLRERQDAYWSLEGRLLELDRLQTRLERIRHVRELARKKWLLEHLGPADLRARYRALRACEAAPF